MNIGKILAITIMVISVMAAMGYGFDGDIRRMIYWLAGATITASVTF